MNSFGILDVGVVWLHGENLALFYLLCWALGFLIHTALSAVNRVPRDENLLNGFQLRIWLFTGLKPRCE